MTCLTMMSTWVIPEWPRTQHVRPEVTHFVVKGRLIRVNANHLLSPVPATPPPFLASRRFSFTFANSQWICVLISWLASPVHRIRFKKELVKVKGLKNPISYDELKLVLKRDEKLIINQEK